MRKYRAHFRINLWNPVDQVRLLAALSGCTLEKYVDADHEFFAGGPDFSEAEARDTALRLRAVGVQCECIVATAGKDEGIHWIPVIVN